MTLLSHFIQPSWKPQKGPKADETQTTYPAFSGNIVPCSVVIKTWGTLHMMGKSRNPRRAKRWLAAFTLRRRMSPRYLVEDEENKRHYWKLVGSSPIWEKILPQKPHNQHHCFLSCECMIALLMKPSVSAYMEILKSLLPSKILKHYYTQHGSLC